MPVSSPSYFPPNHANGSIIGTTAGTTSTGSKNFLAMKAAGNNSTASNLLVIGDSSCNQGLTSANNPTGLICLGNSSLTGTNLSDKTASGEGIIAIGISTVPTAGGDLGGGLFIGNAIMPVAVLDTTGGTGNEHNVVVGSRVLTAFGADSASSLFANVVIGNSTLVAITGASRSVTRNVVIGQSACAGQTHGVQNCVFVGQNAGNFGGSTPGDISSTTVVGHGSLNGTLCAATSRIVVVGDSAGTGTALTGAMDLVLIGSNSAGSLNQGSNVTVVGSNADVSSNGTNNLILGDNINPLGTNTSGCIIIGSHGPAVALPSTTSGQLYIGFNGTALGAGTGTAMWGLMKLGNLCLGTSSALQREFGGSGATNVLKLITGTAGGTAPVGGGYFYVAGTNNSLHWVNSAGTDSTLSDAATLTSLALNAASGVALNVNTSTDPGSITSTGGATITTEILTAATPTTVAGQIGFGTTTTTTATAGANGAVPAQVDSYLSINVAGTVKKIPLFLA